MKNSENETNMLHLDTQESENNFRFADLHFVPIQQHGVPYNNLKTNHLRMKNIKLIFWILTMGLFITFTSCEEENEIISTHTDASALVGGTYSGSLTSGSTIYSDATITLTKINNDSIQAVDVVIASTKFANLNVAGKLNVGAANDEFVLSSGFSSTQKMCGRIIDNTLVLTIPLNKSGTSLSNASTAVAWTFEGVKK
jgi:hypothetical protein